jgi:alpha-tubulin suppressor-like RCC1 family protein
MSEIINKFDILSKLNEDFKREIKLFYVFNNYIKDKEKYNPIGFNALIVTQNDSVYAIGDNSCGQLGLGHNKQVKNLTIVDELCNKQIVDFVNGSTYCMARDNCGNVYFFGSKVFSFGSSDYFNKPEMMKGLNEKPVIAMSSGSYHSLLLTKFDEVYAWGENKFGQIGNGSNNDQLENPIRIEGFDSKKVVMISCGAVFSMALTESGRVYSWGHKAVGNLGIESNRSFDNRRPNPVSIEDHLIVKISCGHSHGLLLTKNGEVYAFGNNKCGQIGIGSYENQSIPKRLEMKNITDVSSHAKHSLSIACTKDQTYYVWGYLTDQRRKITRPEPTKCKTFEEIFANHLKITNKSINLTGEISEVRPQMVMETMNEYLGMGCSKKSEVDFVSKLAKLEIDKPIMNSNLKLTGIKFSDNRYEEEFKELELIGNGSFGNVFKVVKYIDKHQYAVKKISFKGIVYHQISNKH